jgi:hypothetical protein
MPNLDQLLDRKKEMSGQVSTLARGLALAFIGVAWTLLTAHDEPLHTMAAKVSKYQLLLLAAISVLVLVCDLLQYVAATSFTDEAVGRARAATDKTALYNDELFAYKAMEYLYFTKFYILIAGSLVLVIIFVLLFQGISQLPAPCLVSH